MWGRFPLTDPSLTGVSIIDQAAVTSPLQSMTVLAPPELKSSELKSVKSAFNKNPPPWHRPLRRQVNASFPVSFTCQGKRLSDVSGKWISTGPADWRRRRTTREEHVNYQSSTVLLNTAIILDGPDGPEEHEEKSSTNFFWILKILKKFLHFFLFYLCCFVLVLFLKNTFLLSFSLYLVSGSEQKLLKHQELTAHALLVLSSRWRCWLTTAAPRHSFTKVDFYFSWSTNY